MTRPTPDQIRDMVAKSMTDREIGEAFGVSGMTIAGMRRKHGIAAGMRWTPERVAPHSARVAQAHAERGPVDRWGRDVIPRPAAESAWRKALGGNKFGDARTAASVAQRHDWPETYVGREASS